MHSTSFLSHYEAYPHFQRLREKIIQRYQIPCPSTADTSATIMATVRPHLTTIAQRCEELLSLEGSEALEAQEKLLLLHTVTSAVTFVSIILKLFLPWVVYDCVSYRVVCNIFNDFSRQVNPSLEELLAAMQKKKQRKVNRRQVRHQLRSIGLFKNKSIYIHHLVSVDDEPRTLEKQTIFDSSDTSPSTSNTQWYHLKQSTTYVIQPRGRLPEVHLMVLHGQEGETVPSDGEI